MVRKKILLQKDEVSIMANKIKIISDRFMEIIASKTKFRRTVVIMIVLGFMVISSGVVYLLLKDVF